MADRRHSAFRSIGLLAVAAVAASVPRAAAQINTDLVEKNRAEFHKQATDADMKREGGTQPRDWDYALPDGVVTKQITFYVDGGTPLYGKLFLPKGFKTTERRPAVVVGHGINALSIGIEKYAARFADRGLVAMAIDYQSYGFSGSGSDDLRLLEPDPTADASPVGPAKAGLQVQAAGNQSVGPAKGGRPVQAAGNQSVGPAKAGRPVQAAGNQSGGPASAGPTVTDRRLRLVVKRTNLNNAHEVDDYRAAISYLQGEPGVDPDRIGIWGSSNAGSVVIAVAEIDTRAKAVVSQVAGPRPVPRGSAPAPAGPQAGMVDDAIKRARTGQGAEVDGGFSFRSKIDMFGNFRNRDVRPGAALDQIADTTKILFLPAEKDELTNGPGGAIEATKYLTERGITAQTIVYPELTHFQAYSNTGFEVGSTLAAEWFLKYLAAPVPKPSTAEARR
jgi:dienelactone hydrolase